MPSAGATVPELRNELLDITWLKFLLLPILQKMLFSARPNQLPLSANPLSKYLLLSILELV